MFPGSWNSTVGCFEAGVTESARVAHRGLDAEAEQVAQAPDVAAGGMDLLDYAVFAHGLCGEAGSAPGELAAGRCESGRAAACRRTGAG